MKSTMLLYVVFCCLILVQVKGKCLLTELITLISSLTKENVLATCMTREYETLSFPTNWTGCKWSCLDKGLANITENFNSSTSTCDRYMYRIKRWQTALERPGCSSTRCKEHCGHSTGNIYEYLKEVTETLQLTKGSIKGNPS